MTARTPPFGLINTGLIALWWISLWSTADAFVMGQASGPNGGTPLLLAFDLLLNTILIAARARHNLIPTEVTR